MATVADQTVVVVVAVVATGQGFLQHDSVKGLCFAHASYQSSIGRRRLGNDIDLLHKASMVFGCTQPRERERQIRPDG